jgi:Domain of unknown function (DUF6268)
MKFLITFHLLFLSLLLSAQPYLDLVQVNATRSPDAGLWRRNNQQNSFSHLQGDFTIPLIFKKDSSMLLFCPFTEHWWLKIPTTGLNTHYASYGLQLTLVKPLSESWTLNTVLVPRFNARTNDAFKNSFQAGGALLFAYRKSNALTYKFGIYYNSEFSGPFFMPLLGIDWQINPKTTLFGILPGSLNMERAPSVRFSYGLAFRAITNSYQDGLINSFVKKSFMRVDENQLGLYSDFYLTKNLVWNLELGHSVFRRFRAGSQNEKPRFFYKNPMNDGLYVRSGIAYRLRLR